jgi:division protein CdvB (Snf7/Vps24/ESCRT-III family)
MKRQASKLDAHEEQIAEWFRKEKLTLAQAVARLAGAGVKVSASRLSDWWSRYQTDEAQAEAEARLYADLATGSRIAKEVGEMAVNAPTQVGTLIKLVERLILQVSVRGEIPSQLEVLPALVRTALEGVKVQLAERGMAIDEAKLQILQAKAAKAEEAEKIAGDDTTSPEEKAAKIRAVFGMS